MAAMLRTSVLTFGRLACGLAARSSGAAARVGCGIDSTIRLRRSNASFFNSDQDPSFSRSTRTSSAGFSHSGQLPARFQAAVAVCPLPIRHAVRVLEQPLEVEPRGAPETRRPATIDQSAVPLPRSFLAESVTGSLVECSGRGSRPLYTTVLAELHTGTSLPDVLAKQDNRAVRNGFHAALESTPGDAHLVSEYALFTWKSLGAVDSAEELYCKAMALAPHDPSIQASHAVFLWQCDD